MSTETNVQQVKVNLMTQDMYNSATKNVNEFYVITDNDYLETAADIAEALGYVPYSASNPNGYISGVDFSMISSSGIQTVQDIATITTTSGTVSQTVTDSTSMYQITPSGAITSFSFDYTGTAGKAYTFELLVNMSTAYAINWVGITWMGDEIPDMSETGTYFLAFRKIGTGGWLGNLQGKW